MKPTSLIFLVLSVVLFFGGMVTCGVASSMADAQGIAIYELENDGEGNLVYSYPLADERVSKLSLNFADVDVTIIGNAEESRIELYNFDVYSYAVTVSGSSISVDGTVNMMSSMIDLSNGGLRFKGLRYFFVDKPDATLKKHVTVYLSDVSELASLSLTTSNCVVTVKDVTQTIDYKGAIYSGMLLLDGIKTESVVDLYLEESHLTLHNSLITTLDVAQKGGSITLTMNHSELPREQITYEITSETGTITVNGSDASLPYNVVSPAPLSLIRIECDNTPIIIEDNFPTMTPPVVTTTPETTDPAVS